MRSENLMVETKFDFEEPVKEKSRAKLGEPPNPHWQLRPSKSTLIVSLWNAQELSEHCSSTENPCVSQEKIVLGNCRDTICVKTKIWGRNLRFFCLAPLFPILKVFPSGIILKRLRLQGPNFAFLHLNFVAFLFYISIFPIPLSYSFSSRRAITVRYLKVVFLTLWFSFLTVCFL